MNIYKMNIFLRTATLAFLISTPSSLPVSAAAAATAEAPADEKGRMRARLEELRQEKQTAKETWFEAWELKHLSIKGMTQDSETQVTTQKIAIL